MGSLLNTIPYTTLIAIIGLLGFLYDDTNTDRLKRRFTWAAIALFFIFFAFRGYILSDWTSYHPYFEDCTIDWITGWTIDGEYFEPGFTIFTLICKLIYPNYVFFQVACATVTTTLLIRFFRISNIDNLPMAILLYISFEGLTISTNLMRNAIAIVIFLNAIPYLIKRKIIPYMLLCLLAVTFHVSSLLYIPLYFFFQYKCNKWIYLSIIVICNIIFLFHISIVTQILSLSGFGDLFSDKINAYTEVMTGSTGLSIGYLERLFTSTLVFIYYKELGELREKNAVYINGLIAYFIMYFMFSEFEVMSKRLATLFAYGYWIIWLDLIRCFALRHNRILFKAFIFVYCIIKMMGSTYLPDFEYENFLFGARNYQERLYIYNKTPHD